MCLGARGLCPRAPNNPEGKIGPILEGDSEVYAPTCPVTPHAPVSPTNDTAAMAAVAEPVELRTMAVSTRANYERVKGLYLRHMGERAHSTESVIAWADSLVVGERPYAPSSLWPMVSHVLKYLEIELHLQLDKHRIFKHLKALSKTHRPMKADAFSADELLNYVAVRNYPKITHLKISPFL